MPLFSPIVASGQNIGWSDVPLVRGAANTLSLENSANAMALWVNGTTDSTRSNYRRLRLSMTTAGAATIAAEGLGTGVSGNTLAILVNAVSALSFSSAGNATFAASVIFGDPTASISFSGRSSIASPANGETWLRNAAVSDADHFLKFGVNTSAAAGIKRVGTALQIRLNDDSAFASIQPLSVLVPSSNGILGWTSSSYFSAPSDGIIRLSNNAGTGFTRVNFGGDTSIFPSLKRNNTEIQARLADDSTYAPIQSLYERFGSGSPEGVVSAPVSTTYHRNDGGAGTSLYVKESGTGNTGWVAK